MKRRCYFCEEIFGDKEPLEDPSITDGECPLCHFLFTTWFEIWSAGKTTETATQFILNCRKTLGENHKESVVRGYLQMGGQPS